MLIMVFNMIPNKNHSWWTEYSVEIKQISQSLSMSGDQRRPSISTKSSVESTTSEQPVQFLYNSTVKAFILIDYKNLINAFQLRFGTFAKS